MFFKKRTKKTPPQTSRNRQELDVMHAYNPGTWEAEARGSLVEGQPELHSKNLSLKKRKIQEIWLL